MFTWELKLTEQNQLNFNLISVMFIIIILVYLAWLDLILHFISSGISNRPAVSSYLLYKKNTAVVKR